MLLLGAGQLLLLPAAHGQVRIQHVIHLSVDGLRGDLLQGLLDTQGSAFPAFSRMRAEGAVTFNARCDHGSSSTIPNHASMLTGLPLVAPASAPAWQQHGYEINHTVPGDTLHADGDPVRYKSSVFDRAHDRGRRTMLLASKEKFALFDRSYDAANGAPDTDGDDNGPDKIDFALVRNADSSILMAVLIARMGEDFPAYTFVHVFDPDYAGHLFGWGSMNWQLAVKHADSMVGLILSALELRPALKESTALVITADHGGGVPVTNHVDPVHQVNYTIPLMIWGPGVPRGVNATSLFKNRGDPGAGRQENDAEMPPLRNGDTGNIALALLGLPPVTESLYRPEWADRLQVISRPDGRVECRWPLYFTGWTLESSEGLSAASWVPVASAPVVAGEQWQHLEPVPAGPQRFYRLRPPQ